jgi:hypothetical protein
MNEQFSQNSKTFIPLENIRIANPCRADWNMMAGDDRVRFCQSCAKSVYNLSAMSKEGAEKLIAEKEGKLCVQYYQRTDGTIITDNCPVGLKIARRPFKFLVAGFAVLLASGASLAAKESSAPSPSGAASDFKPRNVGFLRAVIERFESDNTPAIRGEIAPTMGKPAPCPPPTPAPTPKPKE